MSDVQSMIVCWTTLVMSSFATMALGNSAKSWLPVLLLAAVKGWVIVDGFMGVGKVSGLWRGLLIGWPVALVLFVGITKLKVN